MIPAQFGWDDVGTWEALGRILPSDLNGNTVIGSHVGIDTTDCVIHSEGQLVATIGISHLIIVQHNGRLLIYAKERSQELKELLQLRSPL